MSKINPFKSKCSKCGKMVLRGAELINCETGKTLEETKNFYIGEECGCFEEYIQYIKDNDPQCTIEELKNGFHIEFSKGKEDAIRLAKEFVKNYVRVQFT